MSHPNLSVWMHVRLSGSPVIPEHATEIFRSQINTLQHSGLMDECSELFVCCNEADEVKVRGIAPAKATMLRHPDGARSELPTLGMLRRWRPSHMGDFVFYSHLKGATRTDPLAYEWRGCMMRKLCLGWHSAVHAMNLGAEAVGCHWLTPERWGAIVRSPYFGGNYWWAKASFLASLPELPETASCREDFYKAESWIGTGPRRPQIVDLHPDWPSHAGCASS